LEYLLGLQEMSLFALACVTKSLPWKIRHRIKQPEKSQTGSRGVARL
jgi:hypothetical protein